MTLDQANNQSRTLKNHIQQIVVRFNKNKEYNFRKNYLGKNCYPFITQSVIDIDDHFDFEIAKF